MSSSFSYIFSKSVASGEPPPGHEEGPAAAHSYPPMAAPKPEPPLPREDTRMDCGCELDDDEVEYLALLLNIVDSRNWKAFGYAVVNDPAVFRSFARKVSMSSEVNGMTILHACVKSNPPSHIIKILLEVVPESPSCLDCLRRTPLHVAAGTGADLATIKLLAKAYPEACSLRDEDGKTPLILACDTSCELFEGDDNSSTKGPPSYEVVEALVKASPLSVPLEDRDGMSALEHAIFSNAPILVVKLLQHVARRQGEKEQEKAIETKSSASNLASSSFDTELLTESKPSAAVVPAKKGEFTPMRRRGGDATAL